jgi:peptidoglycan-N-acetylglucosamine deacetylase
MRSDGDGHGWGARAPGGRGADGRAPGAPGAAEGGGGAQAPSQRGMSRRMLIAGGGLALGAVAFGWRAGGIAVDALDPATSGATAATATTAAGSRSRAVAGAAVRPGHAARPAHPGSASPPGAGHTGSAGHAGQITARSARGARGSHHHTTATPARAPEQPVYYVDDGPKVIALTIDDGPSPVYTPQVLRLLAKYRVTAAFSMIGENASNYPTVARAVADAGHLIVNHTWDHANLTSLSGSRVRAEIAKASDAIEAAAGVRPTMFRAPYGAWSAAALDYCASERLTPLDWSVDPRDWSRPGVSAIVRNILRNTRTGSIILEHDGGGNRSQTVAALTIVIPRLLDEGYRFEVP